MIKDIEYFEKKHITMTENYFIEQNNSNKYIDTLGLVYKDQQAYERNQRRYFYNVTNNGLKNLKNKISYLNNKDNILEFNSSYAVSDMVKGHFQIPQNLKRITDKCFLFMGDNSLNVINIANGIHKKLVTIPTPESLNTSSKFLMASGVIDSYKIFIYDLTSQNFLLRKQIHSNEIANFTKFIEQQQEIVITWNSPEIGIMDLNTLKLKNTLKTREGVNHLDVNLQKQLFVTAQDDNIIQLCDIRNQKENIDFKGHEQSNFATAFLDDNYFATGGEDITTRIWDIRQPKEQVQLLQGEKYQIGDILYDSSRNLLHVLETKKFFYSYDLNNNVPIKQVQQVTAIFQGFSLNENKNKLYIASYHNPLRQFIQEFDIN